MRKTLPGRIAMVTLGCTAVLVGSGISPASADPAPSGSDTCQNGYVPREARPGDTVCVTPEMQATIARQNGNPGAHKDPSQGYGPESCAQGYVWREAFEGDVVCVKPEFRTTVLADNAAASSHKAIGQPQQGPATQGNSVILEVTGTGTASTVDIYDPQAEPRVYDVGLPYTRESSAPPKSGELYQIVGMGKGDTKVGCQITVNGDVVAQQPIGSGQCIYVAP